MVRSWRPGDGERRQAGELSVRTLGSGRPTFVLLHGITASGDIFGAEWDRLATGGRVVVPDLLGFGRSMDEARSDFTLDAHLAALEAMLAALDLEAAPLTLVGHSLGALLALQWAARRSHVQEVVALSAPLYRDTVEADERIRGMGWMERLFGLEGPVAAGACAWMCAHRTTAQCVAVALEPKWPVAIARMGVRHTWPSYLGAMNSVIRNPGWEQPVRQLDAAGVPMLLAEGARDPVPVPGRSTELAARYRNVNVIAHPTADHELPMTEPAWCIKLLQRN